MEYIPNRGDVLVVVKLWSQAKGLTVGKEYVVVKSFYDETFRDHKDNGFWIQNDNGKIKRYKHGNQMFALTSRKKEEPMSLLSLSLSDLDILRKECHWRFDEDMKHSVYTKEQEQMWRDRLSAVEEAIDQKVDDTFKKCNY